jgi:hypothetical protein
MGKVRRFVCGEAKTLTGLPRICQGRTHILHIASSKPAAGTIAQSAGGGPPSPGDRTPYGRFVFDAADARVAPHPALRSRRRISAPKAAGTEFPRFRCHRRCCTRASPTSTCRLAARSISTSDEKSHLDADHRAQIGGRPGKMPAWWWIASASSRTCSERWRFTRQREVVTC